MSVPKFAACFARLCLLPIPLICSPGCAATQRRDLEPADVERALSVRERGPLAELDAEQLAGLDALSLARPGPQECSDPRSGGYWRACALVWNPQVRAARRELEGALAAAGLAGKPGEIEFMAETMEFDDVELDSKLALTVDLLGILGLGPNRIARAGARVDVRLAHRSLERAVWNAVFDVERTRLRLAASRERTRKLNLLEPDVAVQDERFEILERRGRLSEADALMVKAALHEIEHARSRERSREMELALELSRISGMPFDHAALASIDAAALDEDRSVALPRTARQLLEQDPELRELTLEYAQAELEVRRVAAQAWPTLRAGPQFTFVPSDVLLGGVLDLSLPWPGRVEKEIRVAQTEREAARERVEDALNQAVGRVASLRVIEAEARARAEEHALDIDGAAAASWQAVNARLRAGMSGAIEWSKALRDRIPPLLALVDERESAAIAALDLQQACGVVSGEKQVLP